MAKIKYRLGLDMGTNSLGWCVYRLNESDDIVAIQRMGVRIYSDGRDPKSLASNAADRRLARQARRRRDRVLKRRARIMEGLIEFGLMPNTEIERKKVEALNPYELRKKGLDSQLSPFEIGRAIYHLCRKRGFKSSRKDRGNSESEKETGKVKQAVAALKVRIQEAGCRTVGEYLANEHINRRPVRARRASDGQYVLYMQRDMVQAEFDFLWEKQKTFHANILNEKAYQYLKDSLLFQRRLHPVMPGRCLFETSEYRAPLASPIQQEFRILQELNNLRVKEGVDTRFLSLEERDAMFNLLNSEAKQVSFAKLAKIAGLANATAFNLESEKRKGLNGNSTAAQFSADSVFGSEWDTFSAPLKEGLALLIMRATDDVLLEAALLELPKLDKALDIARPKPHEKALIEALAELGRGVTQQTAKNICLITLPDDYASLSLKALAKIVPKLKSSVITYDKAVIAAGYSHHSQLYTGEFFKQLPYYGQILQGYTSPADKAKAADERQFGKIANPTVHIGLNQLRQLINALIKRYGHPYEVIIELAREFGVSGENRREIMKSQADNQARNERYDAQLETLGQRKNRENRLKLQLWEELGKDDALDRHCIYSGKRLSKALLFSDEIEIDHILPFSRTLNDGLGNKILCFRQSNRDKGNRTPHEAWGHTDKWQGILERAERLPGRKPTLFKPDAVEAFLDGKDFLDRQLTDTAYLSRAAKQYLSAVCPPNYIWVSTGKLTGMLRGKWGLNALLSDNTEKNRNDHRHHALDAAVIGACSRSVIRQISDAAKQAEATGENRALKNMAYPWPTFRTDLKETLEKVNVSHKPDHGFETALHNDTNYGLKEQANDKNKQPLVARYVSITALSEKDLENILDERVRNGLHAIFAEHNKAVDVKAAIEAFSVSTGIKRTKKTERLSVIPIHSRKDGKAYRYVKGDGNYCYEIFMNEKGKWDGLVITNFEANQAAYNPKSKVSVNGKPLIMRIRKGDVLSLRIDQSIKLYRVVAFTDGKISLAEPFEANVDLRDRNKSLPYMRKSPGTLQPLNTALCGVDILGYVNNLGVSRTT